MGVELKIRGECRRGTGPFPLLCLILPYDKLIWMLSAHQSYSQCINMSRLWQKRIEHGACYSAGMSHLEEPVELRPEAHEYSLARVAFARGERVWREQMRFGDSSFIDNRDVKQGHRLNWLEYSSNNIGR